VTPETTGCSNSLLTVPAKRDTPKSVKALVNFPVEMASGLKSSVMTATYSMLMAVLPNAPRKISSFAPMSFNKGPSVGSFLKSPHLSTVSLGNLALPNSHSKSHSLPFIPSSWQTTGPKTLL
jgi:hypothetical protein